MSIHFNQRSDKSHKFPFFSAAAIAAPPLSFGLSVATVSLAPVLAMMLASPYVMAAAGAWGGVNLFRNRSKLSKAFSGAALGTAVIGGGAYWHQMTQSDWMTMDGNFSTTFALMAAGALNTIAHYKRNDNLKTGAPVNHPSHTPKGPDNTPQ